MGDKMTPDGLRELADRQTYGESDGPPLRAALRAAADAWEAERRGEIYLGKPLAWWVECNNAAIQGGYKMLIGEVVDLRKRLEAAERLLRGWKDANDIQFPGHGTADANSVYGKTEMFLATSKVKNAK